MLQVIFPKSRKSRLIIGLITFTLIMMWLAPFGSFNPMNQGFYLSILSGLVWTLILGVLLNRFQGKSE